MPTERIKTVAGALVGEGKHTVCRFDEDAGAVVGALKLRGRWLYVQKCRRPEAWGDIIIPDYVRDNSVFDLVLAFGSECGADERPKLGTRRAAKRKMRWYLPQMEFPVDEIECGKTIVLGPDDHEWGIMRSPFSREEYFMHECLAMAIIEP